MASYPIYSVTNSDVKRITIGSKDYLKEKIMIGNGKKNSYPFVEIETKLINQPFFDGNGTWVFQFMVDGEVIKTGIFEDKNGKPGDLIDAI